MTASEILLLARRSGIAPEVSVLDLCCGTGGPGRLILGELGGTYLGVDASPHAVAGARTLAEEAGLRARFEVVRVPPVPSGPFDVVVLLETLLAFADKRSLLREVSSSLPVGGRFAFTVEEGEPLTDAERARMPEADTVRLIPRGDLLRTVEDAGLRVRWAGDWSRSHLGTVDALIDAYTAAAADISTMGGADVLNDLLTAHRHWSDWLRDGRVRKFALVAEKVAHEPSRR